MRCFIFYVYVYNKRRNIAGYLIIMLHSYLRIIAFHTFFKIKENLHQRFKSCNDQTLYKIVIRSLKLIKYLILVSRRTVFFKPNIFLAFPKRGRYVYEPYR